MSWLASLAGEFINYTALFLASSIVGLFIACLLNGSGLVRKAERLIRPLLGPAGLPPSLLPAIVSAIVNASRAEHMIIYDYYKRGLMDDDGVVYYVISTGYLRGVGVVLLHVGPVVLAALGPALGSIYLALLYLKYVINSLIGIAYGKVKRVRITGPNVDPSPGAFGARGCTKALAHRCSLRALRVALSVLPKFAIIMAVVLALEQLDVFSAFAGYIVKSLGTYAGILLSPAAITVLTTAIVSPSAAYFVGSSLLAHGQLSSVLLITALMAGSTIGGLTIGLTRHSLPFYLSIYPPKLALRIGLTQAAVDAVSLTLIITAIALVH